MGDSADIRITRMSILLFLLSFIFLAGPAEVGHAGAYIFAGESNGVDVVTHPLGYSGSGGTVVITVGILDTSPNAASMEISVKNIVSRFNNLAGSNNNMTLPNDDLASSDVDFESTALHELGHAMGLAHVNLATESGLSGDDRNYSKTTDGADNIYNLGIGADGVRGSEDDSRGDDVNLNWFRIGSNDPFASYPTVDSTTFSRDVGNLPGGDSFVANADRTVAGLYGYSTSGTLTEAVMQQGTTTDEVQRILGHDDVAALRYAMTGLDELADTSDDYTYWLVYSGLTDSADILLSFDDAETSFAVTQTGGSYLNATHIKITSAVMYFNTGYNWYFNPTYEFNTVTTQAVGDIASTTATGNGNITELGTPTPSAYGVCWSTSEYPTIDDDCSDEGPTSSTGAFTTSITGLSNSTTYYVRTYVTNDNGTNYGSQVSFTTTAGGPTTPTVSTTSVSNITGVSASSGGNVSDDGGDPVTKRGVCWNTTGSPEEGGTDSCTTNGTGTGTFSSSLSGLTKGTTYYIRAYALNSVGTAYGDQQTFTTLDAPTISTTSVSSISDTTATSGGNVSSDGGAAVTARGVCWNTTGLPEVGGSDSCTTDGSGTGSFSSSITGLDPSTTYYVRAYATNSVGTSYGGSGESFTTLANYTLTFTVDVAGGGSLSGTSVQTVAHGQDGSAVTAVPDTGYKFNGWTGDYTGTDNPLTITNVTSDLTIHANFVAYNFPWNLFLPTISSSGNN